jgi:hypothetical protein
LVPTTISVVLAPACANDPPGTPPFAR